MRLLMLSLSKYEETFPNSPFDKLRMRRRGNLR
jgi:hypothetical protein